MLSALASMHDWLFASADSVIIALIAVIASTIIARRARRHSQLLTSALNNVTQGLCMLEGSARILVGLRFGADQHTWPWRSATTRLSVAELIGGRGISGQRQNSQVRPPWTELPWAWSPNWLE